MEGFLNLTFGYFGVDFPLHKPYPYSLYRFSYLHFRYLPEMFGDLWGPIISFITIGSGGERCLVGKVRMETCCFLFATMFFSL